MKAVVALLLGVASSSSGPTWMEEMTLARLEEIDTLAVFNQWAQAFEREYKDHEEAAQKYLVWLDNMHAIASSNSLDFSYKLRMNQFGDMTKDEFRQYIHGDVGSCLNPLKTDPTFIIGGDHVHEEPVNAPASVDWTSKGVVTPVKNQGQCGSCWAFSTTGSLECDYAIKSGTLNSLSEQELVDCVPITDGCMGCNGGSMDGAMKWVQKNGGLCSESEYSYTARNGACKSSSCGTKYNANTGHTDVTADSETSLVNAVANGCVSVAIEADQTAFQYYSSGVLTGNCGTNLDHGVLVVGYGTSGSTQYWKVKNSWGTSWGEKGYVLICKDCGKNGNKGECGILMQPSYPTF
jgi:C1A family cysteine protease